MRIVFHVGMGKTGTSSLQSTLARNRIVLERAGVIYPKMDNGSTHQLLSAIAKPYEARPRGLDHLSVEDWRLAQDKVKAAIVDSASRRPSVILFSTEYALDFREDGQQLLRTLFEVFTHDISVVVWLRDPIDYYRSFINQRAKPVGNPSRDRGAPDPRKFSPGLRKRVNRLRSVWPSVSINLYDRKQMIEGNIISDFVYRALPEARGIDFTIHHRNADPAPPISDECRATLCASCQDDIAFLFETFGNAFTHTGMSVVQLHSDRGY
ncbi:hypothetical protein [Luteimonas salinilitoris]|uniref:Sulfotransferase family protein n=1 Tax=Luteimonas salinilitoris TaxID=3237697 RepID=A0ABV4HVW6_9GAMM